MPQKHLEAFGEPVITAGPFSLWVHGYEFPQATDGWDGNWLHITARCVANGASVIVTGAFLDTLSFHRLREELTPLYERLEGEATLKSHEPNLIVRFKAAGQAGQVKIEIEITPDHMQQLHRFYETIDQSYLRSIQAACNAVLRAYPIRDPESRGIAAN